MDLGLTRIERGDLLLGCAGLLAACAALGKPGVNGGGALAQGTDCLVRHARDFEHGVLAGRKSVSQLSHAMCQLLPVDRADLLLELVEGARLQAAPGAVLVLGGVEDDGMGVKLRVLCPACRMTESGNRQIAGHLAHDLAATTNAGCGHVLFDMGECDLHRRAVGDNQPLVAHNLGHDRDRLGRGQGDIPSGAMLDLAVAGGAKLFPGHPAFEQFGKLLAVNFAFQAQRGSALAEPFGRGKTAFGMIVIGLVVACGLASTGECRDRSDHQTGPGLTSGAALRAISLTRLHRVSDGSPAT